MNSILADMMRRAINELVKNLEWFLKNLLLMKGRKERRKKKRGKREEEIDKREKENVFE